MRRVGDEVYARALAEHRVLIRAALEAHGGDEKDTQGDSFFATFTSPTACVAAAVEIQVALGAFQLPNDEHLRVRIGIHTGEVMATSTGIVGFEVHRAARIGAVAHGGQVVLSAAAAGLLGDSLPPGVSLRELGAHRLKDLGRPETLFQVVATGLQSQFAPVRSLDHSEVPNNLPVALSPFVGRVEELKGVVALLQDSRLVTLTGAGGCGKTRLALQAAAEVLDEKREGVWLVELAALSDPGHVATSVIDALKIQRTHEGDDLNALLFALREQSCMIVLDNCEHMIDAVAQLADLISRSCSRISIMATSREPLGVDGEEVFRVRSMSLPPSDIECTSDLGGSDAVGLFVARARSLDKAFTVTDANAAAVGEICRRLDGIPLAIELAAARLSSMSLPHLRDRLDQRLRLLTGGSRNVLPRQQTLGAMVAWSYDLLTEAEREVLRRLTVFVDGFALEAAEAVCATDTIDSLDIPEILGQLVNKSLVVVERSEMTIRYRLLETIRQYGAEQLVQVDGEDSALDVRRLHSEYFLSFCEGLSPGLIGPRQADLFKQLDVEWGNAQAALDFFEDAGRLDCVALIVIAVDRYCQCRLMREPFVALRRAIESESVPASLRALAITTLGNRVYMDTFFGSAPLINMEMCSGALTLAQELGDRRLEVRAWLAKSELERRPTDIAAARGSAVAALTVADDVGDPWLRGLCLYSVAAATPRGERREYIQEAVAIFRRVGDLHSLHWSLQMLTIDHVLATEETLLGDRERTIEQLEIADALGIRYWGGFTNLALIECVLGNNDSAVQLARTGVIRARRSGVLTEGLMWPALVFATCEARDNNFERAGILLGSVSGWEPQWLDRHGDTWTSQERAVRAEAVESVVRALGEVEFNRLTDIGRDMSADTFLDFALETSPSEAS
jgi:predicted ATPase